MTDAPEEDIVDQLNNVAADTSRWSMTGGAGGGSSSFGAGSEAGGGSSGASFGAGGGAGGGYPQHVADAIAAIPELEREIERMKTQIHHLQSISPYNHKAPELAADNMRLRARVAELEAALKQFADPENWSDRVACLQWMGKLHAIEFAKRALAAKHKD